MALVFGRVPHPPYQRRIVENSEAWDDLGVRVIVGTCLHTMVGTLWGTDGYFRGEARRRALTDYGVGGATDGTFDGVILMWNDPRSRRSPWANGNTRGLEGDGSAFVQKFGVVGVGRNLVSIERSDGANIDTPMSPKQFESICQLIAYWHDQASVPWDAFPVNPTYGVVTQMQHYEFTDKAGNALTECPGPAVRNATSRYQARVKDIMRHWQAGDAPPLPPPPPPAPEPLPYAALFGEADGFAFDPRGPITKQWLATGASTNRYPPLVRVVEHNGKRFFQFADGTIRS